MKKTKKIIKILISTVLLFNFVFLSLMQEAKASMIYNYELVYQSPYPSTLAPGETTLVSLEIKNTGLVTWFNSGVNPVRLGSGSSYGESWQSRNYSSEFHDDDWLSDNRPVPISDIEILPGETTTFEFNIKAPENPGNYKAYFTPVVDGHSWMRDIGIYWEVDVSRRLSYSFDYYDPSNPLNEEVNKNTDVTLSESEELLVNALKKELSYDSIHNVSIFDIRIKLSDGYALGVQEDLVDMDSFFYENNIPINILEEVENNINISFENETKAINSDLNQLYSKFTSSVSTINNSNQTNNILDSEAEFIFDGSEAIFYKVNNFDLLGDYFSYSKPNTWFRQSVDSNITGFDLETGRNYYENTKNINNLFDYGRAMVRDLYRADILIENNGLDSVEDVECEKLRIKLNKENVSKYIDIINETSTISQSSIDAQKEIIGEYFGDSYIYIWINPETNLVKRQRMELNIKNNDFYDVFSITIDNTIKSFNDSSMIVDLPDDWQDSSEFDMIDQLNDKISTISAVKARISSVRRGINKKYELVKNKVVKYLRDKKIIK